MEKQESLLLNLANSLASEINNLPNIIIIFEHCAALIDFAPSMKKSIYRITDEKLDDPNQWKNTEEFSQIYMQNIDKAVSEKKRILLINYNPATALMTQKFIELYEEDNSGRILCLSFFHDDEETYLTHIDGIEDLLDYKFNLILSMIDYSYIRKITVPFNFKISTNYLSELFNELY